jgi:hypothetical protein
VRLLRSIILIHCESSQESAHDEQRIAAQFISHDLSGFAPVAPFQPFKEALGRRSVTTGLQEYIYYFAILIHSTSKVVLLAVDLDEDFIDLEGVAIVTMLSFQAAGINGSKFDTPEAN